MSLPFHLGLRHYRHMVSHLRDTGRVRDRLGVAYPDDHDRRGRVLEQWGIERSSPREPPPSATIPVPRRVQAALAPRVAPSVQKQLFGIPDQAPTRWDARPGLHSRMHLDQPTTLQVDSPRRRGGPGVQGDTRRGASGRRRGG